MFRDPSVQHATFSFPAGRGRARSSGIACKTWPWRVASRGMASGAGRASARTSSSTTSMAQRWSPQGTVTCSCSRLMSDSRARCVGPYVLNFGAYVLFRLLGTICIARLNIFFGIWNLCLEVWHMCFEIWNRCSDIQNMCLCI